MRGDLVPAVLHHLGARVAPTVTLAPDEFGPPAPPMLLPARRRKPEPAQPRITPTGPFAALANLRPTA